MPDKSSWRPLVSILVVAVLAAVGATLMVSRALARGLDISAYLLSNLVVFLDSIDFFVRLYLRRIHSASASGHSPEGTSIGLDVGRYSRYQKRLHLRPYAFVVSLFNAEPILDEFVEHMEPYRDRTWVIDDGSTDRTSLRLRQAGWHCIEDKQNRKKPGAIRQLLKHLPRQIETVVVLDPDILIRDSPATDLSRLEEVIFDFQRSGMAAVCPRIAIKPGGFLARFEALEYCVAFGLGRRSLADQCINSGVSIYARSALEAALEKHSLSVYAEDLENSILLLSAGKQTYYDSRLVVETEGRSRWRDLFSQRVGWSYGMIKVYLQHFDDIREIAKKRISAGYQFLVYMGGFNLMLQPLRCLSLFLLLLSFLKGVDGLLGLDWTPSWRFADPIYFLAAFAKYALLSLVALFAAVPAEERKYILPVVPLYFLYSLALIVPTTVGYANWFSLRLLGRRIIHDHYQDHEALIAEVAAS